MKALYAYQAQGADELSLQEGMTYELTPDGENFGDGWWEGIDSKGKKVSSRVGYSSCNLANSDMLWSRVFSQVTMYGHVLLYIVSILTTPPSG